MSNIIVFSDYENLKKEVEKLHAELTDKLLERDELRFIVCRNIEMEYMLKLGSAEYKAFEAQVEMLRLKRKKELIQAKINRREKIETAKIESQLDLEFEQFREELESEIEAMAQATKRRKGKTLSDDKTKELKELYHKVVKALHPDLHPNISKAKLNLFEQAVDSYKCADLNTLKIISEMIDEKEFESDNTLDSLKNEKNNLEELIRVMENEIKEIKSEYPYNMKELLEDEGRIREKKAEYEQILGEYKEEIKRLKSQINNIEGKN